MANAWFRMYSEFAFDPKVQVLTEALQRRYVMALCLHCDNKLQNRPDDEVALSLRVTVEEWLETKSIFIERGLMTKDGKISGWDKRQYISDIKDPTAAERQKRYRKNKRNARNASVTSRLPESDTDTETDTEKEKKHDAGAASPSAWDLGVGMGIPRSVIGKAVKSRGEGEVVDLLARMSLKPPADPVSYFTAAMKPKAEPWRGAI